MKDSLTAIITFTTILFSTILVILHGFGLLRAADNAEMGEIYEHARIMNAVETENLGRYLDDNIIASDVDFVEGIDDKVGSAVMVYGSTLKQAILRNEYRVSFTVNGASEFNLEAIEPYYVYAVSIDGEYYNSLMLLDTHGISKIDFKKIGKKKGVE